jgi:hypothetical protein
MAYPPRYLTISGGSGTLTAAPVAGTTTAGTAIATASLDRETVSCLFNVLAETNTLTLTGKFQVSLDNSTWYDLAGDAQNPANVVLATGTAGADTAVTRVLPVPPAALGWNWIRAAVVNGVATGAAGDTYAFTFQCRKFSGF